MKLKFNWDGVRLWSPTHQAISMLVNEGRLAEVSWRHHVQPFVERNQLKTGASLPGLFRDIRNYEEVAFDLGVFQGGVWTFEECRQAGYRIRRHHRSKARIFGRPVFIMASDCYKPAFLPYELSGDNTSYDSADEDYFHAIWGARR